MKQLMCILFSIGLVIFASCGNKDDDAVIGTFQLQQIDINGNTNAASYSDIDPNMKATLVFSEAVDQNTIKKNITFRASNGQAIELIYNSQDKIIAIEPAVPLDSYTSYQLIIQTGLKSNSGHRISTGKVYAISTGLDSVDKYPRISDEELLTLVQKQTFRYFWDFGHPVSGMARERSSSGDVVTTGGTGFGIMAMIVAAERRFVSRQEAAERVLKITRFLKERCTSYHGAFAHWINGSTGETKPFSTKDDGADLVETSFLFQGLLTAREYFDGEDTNEAELRRLITELWEAVEWNWFRQNGQNTLYWHWSPVYGWEMNMKISGWNESLITYVLAAASPTHSIPKEVYDNGWARNGAMRNDGTYYGYKLPLGPSYGGPMFFAHYSFLGLNPNGLKDAYADYGEQNVNHARINYEHSLRNPGGYLGYSDVCWGLTASDGNNGYSAHSPSNDKGVIAPTAALSSMPYTPEESMAALRFFYYTLGDKLWKEYGFIDAFNLTEKWYASDFLAIDQGPIIVMIENYRTGLLWNLLGRSTEIQAGLKKLGFETRN
ncbi:MAG TPA: beta-glucosidase [Porphyromonadaceae bacterium]|nr:beta-glucosidase [Porphyromonadaceae bacterium]HBX21806.1 beta-glucosidase [Porphyromonadaceae bacterium]HCM19797.1 beta-glucosidase [Porphyromonadaceae bacterium]